MKACSAHGASPCKMCHGGNMANGGPVDKEKVGQDSLWRAFKTPDEDKESEEDKKKKKIADDPDRDAILAGGGYASGGLVDSIMKKMKGYSEGGRVANDTQIDLGPAEYDDLVLRDDLDFSYTGANSGDEIGDAQEDQDRRDMVAWIMKKRKKAM